MNDTTEETEKPCKDKLVFDTKLEAENIALAVDWQRGAKLKSYRCKYCKLWHLTSSHD